MDASRGTRIVNRAKRLRSLATLAACATFSVSIGVKASASESISELSATGQHIVDQLQKPEYAASSCMLSPIFATDGVTVAVTADRVFASGDVVIGVGDDPVDPTAAHPLVRLLVKHGADEILQIKIRRAPSEQLVVTAKCSDRKLFTDLLLESAYAASKNDASTCVDKMIEARRLHALSAVLMDMGYLCELKAGRIVGNPNQAQGFYEIRRELILENEWSSDALGKIRGTILSAVDRLRKHNNSLLGDDLMQMYDRAVAARSPMTVAADGR
jgi:hypothetical protein